jgi:hypothetical protein
VAAAAGTAVSVVVSGPHVLIDYPRSLLDRAGWDHYEFGHRQVFFGWNGFLWQVFAWGSPGHVAGTILLSVATVVIIAACWRHAFEPESRAFYPACSALILGTILVNPHVLMHDLTLLIAAIAFSARADRDRFGSYGYWPAIAVGCWAACLFGVVTDVNVVTPAIAGLLVYDLHQTRPIGEPVSASIALRDGLAAT